MQVILLERIRNLGFMGDIVEVKPGYARNFLLPKRKVLRATKNNLESFKSQKIKLEASNLEKLSEANRVLNQINGVNIDIQKNASETGNLYGSIRSKDIVMALDNLGIKVSYEQIDLPKPIKNLGTFSCRIFLHPEVAAEININVIQSLNT